MDTLVSRAKRLGLRLVRSTTYDALSGRKMPSRDTTLAIVAACVGEIRVEEQKLWSEAWQRATRDNLGQQRQEPKSPSGSVFRPWDNNVLAGQVEGIVRRLLDSIDAAEAVRRLAELGPKLLDGLAHETNIDAAINLFVDADDTATAALILLNMDPLSAVRLLSRADTASAVSWLSHMPLHKTAVLMMLMDTDAMAAALLLMGGPAKAAELQMAIAFGAALDDAAEVAEDLAAQDRAPEEGAGLLLDLDLATGIKLLLTVPADQAADWLGHLSDVEAGMRLTLLLDWTPDSAVAAELGEDVVVRMLDAFAESVEVSDG